jgi:Do/DeqQ family serine protease
MARRNLVLIAVAVAALVASPSLILAAPRPPSTDASLPLEAMQSSFREVAKKVLPVVVEINVTSVVKQPSQQMQTPFDWFFNQPPGGNGPREFKRGGLGSGIIVRRAGDTYYVVTNNHVVDEATDISVKLYDQRDYKAKVVGKDDRKDLAVVSFTTRESLPVAELGDSNALEVGDIVLAVGNPLGFENTVTMGIVSALGRRGPQGQSVSPSTDYIQTDASINQGNSGGALVNIRGEVIGINTWIAAPSGGNVGLGFAIPINNAKKAIDDFISKGKVEYGWLGVLPDDVQAMADRDTYPGVAKDMRIEGVKGALVLNVFKNSPADKAGLMPGDYITRVNGQDIKNRDDLILLVGNLLAGRSYDFEVVRYGERQKLPIRLGVRDDKSEASSYKNMWPGISVVRITDEIRKEADLEKGLNGVVIGLVADPETPAGVAGLRPGDVVLSINGRAVSTVMDFYKALNEKSRREVTFKVNRKGTEVTVTVGR